MKRRYVCSIQVRLKNMKATGFAWSDGIRVRHTLAVVTEKRHVDLVVPGPRLLVAHNKLPALPDRHVGEMFADSLPEVIAVEQDADELFSAAKLVAEFAGPGATRIRLEQTRRTLTARLEEQGCVYVPAANRFYVRELRMNYAASETARFLHHACRGFKSPEDSNAAKVTNALAHFGSRLICPGPQEHGDDLGESLYRAYLEGQIGKAAIRRIFLAHDISVNEIKAFRGVDVSRS